MTIVNLAKTPFGRVRECGDRRFLTSITRSAETGLMGEPMAHPKICDGLQWPPRFVNFRKNVKRCWRRVTAVQFPV